MGPESPDDFHRRRVFQAIFGGIAFIGFGSEGAARERTNTNSKAEWIFLNPRTRISREALQVLRANRNKIMFNARTGELSIAMRRANPAMLIAGRGPDEINAIRVLSHNHGALLSFQYEWGSAGLKGVTVISIQREADGFFASADTDIDFNSDPD
jgi:hypothetical protein